MSKLRVGSSGPHASASDFANSPADGKFLAVDSGQVTWKVLEPSDLAADPHDGNGLSVAVGPDGLVFQWGPGGAYVQQRTRSWFPDAATLRHARNVVETTPHVTVGPLPYDWDASASPSDDDGSPLSYAIAAIDQPTGAFVLSESRFRQYTVGDCASDILLAAPSRVNNIWLGDDLPKVGTVGTFISAIGGSALTHAGAGAQFPVEFDSQIGRWCFGGDTQLDRALVTADGAMKTTYVMLKNAPLLGAGLQQYCAISGGVYPLAIGNSKDAITTSPDEGSPVVYRDGQAGTAVGVSTPAVFRSDVAGNVTASYKLGGFNGFAMSVVGRIYGAVQLLSLPTDQEDARIVRACQRYLGTKATTAFCVFGDSIPAGHVSAPNLFNPAIGACRIPSCYGRNFAVAGYTLQDVLDNLATNLAAIDQRGFPFKVAFLYEDINSYLANWSAAQVLAANWSFCTTLRALGWRVVLSTCMSATALSAPQQASRVSGNATKLNEWRQYADGLIDFAAMNIPLVDGLHPTVGGYGVLAAATRSVVLNLSE